MRDVAVVGFAQAPAVRQTHGTTNGVEMLVPVFREVFDSVGLSKGDIGFWCSGSSDYVAGRAFSFIAAVDAIGAFPPINESHVESDAAWALYEAWVKIQTGEVDTALVYGFGKSSAGKLRRVMTMQLDPYTVGPLWPDSLGIAGLQARAGLDQGAWTEEEMAAVAVRSRTDALDNPLAQLKGSDSAESLLQQPYIANPLRKHDCAPITDGAAAIILAAGDRARELRSRPAWITGIAHRIDSANLGGRDLTKSPSTVAAARDAGFSHVDVAELHAPFTHQELLLRKELSLNGTRINPSGGPLCGNPMFAAGLIRIGEAARQVWDGNADSALAHATSGPALQQNLVCVMEGRD
ncbi:thiolase domain-containing protein [Actinocrispum sp. NPDC049592]|uniref:thiolase domain-containing protein n=1 Tax=Actinocrispum sp. NPDC049592 TaxID=3154835 RepID=UPI003444F461